MRKCAFFKAPTVLAYHSPQANNTFGEENITSAKPKYHSKTKLKNERIAHNYEQKDKEKLLPLPR